MLVRSLIPRLWETLNKLFGAGLINFSNEFLKIWNDTDLRIFKFEILFFDCARKVRVRKIYCSARHVKKFATVSSLIELITSWSIIIKIVKWLFQNNFTKRQNFLNQLLKLKYSKHSSWYKVFFDDSLIAIVTAGAALYSRLSILLLTFILFDLS